MSVLVSTCEPGLRNQHPPPGLYGLQAYVRSRNMLSTKTHSNGNKRVITVLLYLFVEKNTLGNVYILLTYTACEFSNLF